MAAFYSTLATTSVCLLIPCNFYFFFFFFEQLIDVKLPLNARGRDTDAGSEEGDEDDDGF